MALKIIDEKIVGTIEDLEDKLEGKLPVDRLELLYLINSWGRSETIVTHNNDNRIKIEQCKEKECYDLSRLDTSKITNMDDLFVSLLFTDIHSTNGIGLHDGDISNWNVFNVTSMNNMFANSKNFNQDLNSWNTSNVISMSGIFYKAINFNQDISNWNVSNVTDMSYMFCRAINFNQDISKWDVSNVVDMNYMFSDAKNFNQSISKWDTSNVTSMMCMFTYAINFNQDISNWNVSKVKDMSEMFSGSENFNQDLSKWDISNVINMVSMFYKAKLFNQNISKWNLDNIINCDFMFNKAESFLDKYNSGEPLPKHTDDIKDWVNLNRDRINAIDTKIIHGEEIDNFFSTFNNKLIKDI